MALGLDVKPNNPQEGMNVPVNFVGQKKPIETIIKVNQPQIETVEQPAKITSAQPTTTLSEQPLVNQGIPTAPTAPKLETDEADIDQFDSEKEKEEEEAIKDIEKRGLQARVEQIQKEIEQYKNQEPIAQAAESRIRRYKNEYIDRFPVRMAIIGAEKPYNKPYAPIMEDINRLPKEISKELTIANGLCGIMALCAGYESYHKTFNQENIAAIKAKGLSEEEKIDTFYKQLLEKSKVPEIINRELVQTPWGQAILEYKQAA